MKQKYGLVSRNHSFDLWKFEGIIGKPIPGHLYRTFIETECLLSLNDRGKNRRKVLYFE